MKEVYKPIELAVCSANFVVYKFEDLTARYNLLEDSFREENEKHDYPRSSYRMKLLDSVTKNTIIVKQFNYDWAPPAYGCPALWANHTDGESMPKPFYTIINDSVAWSGRNYRNESALSVILNRTMIEISVEGSKGKEPYVDLSAVAIGLSPMSSDQLSSFLQQSYVEASYTKFKSTALVNVPMSFWKCSSSELKFQTGFAADTLPDYMQPLSISIPDDRYVLNSTFCYSKTNEIDSQKLGRFEFIYTLPENSCSAIRVITWPKEESYSISFPPEPDRTQKFDHLKSSISDKEVFIAYRDEEVGPYEVVWQGKDYNYLLLVEPQTYTNQDWLTNLMGGIFESNEFA